MSKTNELIVKIMKRLEIVENIAIFSTGSDLDATEIGELRKKCDALLTKPEAESVHPCFTCGEWSKGVFGHDRCDVFKADGAKIGSRVIISPDFQMFDCAVPDSEHMREESAVFCFESDADFTRFVNACEWEWSNDAEIWWLRNQYHPAIYDFNATCYSAVPEEDENGNAD